MCAIAGMIGIQWNDKTIVDMHKTMLHRGPDGKGIYEDRNCCLLHTRLAIIDPEGGRQPMELNWEGEDYALTYNGELYNTEELRSELIRLGHHFLGHSDTEVVLHAYAQWKEGCLDRFNGIFAFAVWRPEKQKLFLARDRMGVKPLFYWESPDGLLFASEIKTILAHGAVKPRLDTQGIWEVMMLAPGRKPGSGVFHGIREIEPGCCACYQDGKLQVRQYWRLEDQEHTETFSQTAEHVRWLVTDAIRRQMVSDVPIGTFLSGGLDSSLISAVCAKEMASKGEKLDTFSLDYVDQQKYFQSNKFQPASDTAFIQIMQEAITSQHHWTVLSPEDLLNALEASTIARDLPGMGDVDFSLLAFCGEIRSHVKVALSGECADEIFGGYPWYRDPEVRAADGFPWAQNTRYRASFLHPRYRNNQAEEFVDQCYRDTVAQAHILPDVSPLEKRMKEMVELNHRWFMQTLLDRKDRMSMYHGLEVRVPFCDYRIAEYLYSVPWEMKDHNGEEKGLLRYAMEGILPDAVLHRKKSPYPKTFHPRYTQLVSDHLKTVLNDKNSPLLEIVDKAALETLLTEESIWPWYGQLMRRPQLMAFMLQIDFWLRRYKIEIP